MPKPLRTCFGRTFFRMQARRMLAFEQDACRRAAQVIAVSEKDAATIRSLFGVAASAVATGWTSSIFRPPERTGRAAEGLVFVGSMTGCRTSTAFCGSPVRSCHRFRARRKDLPVVVVGRRPPPAIRVLADGDPYFHVAGTVPERAAVPVERCSLDRAVADRRGTRLKIYEAMRPGFPSCPTTGRGGRTGGRRWGDHRAGR